MTCYTCGTRMKKKIRSNSTAVKALTFDVSLVKKKLNCVVISTEHQTFMGSTGEIRVPLIGVMFKDMLKPMKTESTLGFPSEGMEWEPSGYLITCWLFFKCRYLPVTGSEQMTLHSFFFHLHYSLCFSALALTPQSFVEQIDLSWS